MRTLTFSKNSLAIIISLSLLCNIFWLGSSLGEHYFKPKPARLGFTLSHLKQHLQDSGQFDLVEQSSNYQQMKSRYILMRQSKREIGVLLQSTDMDADNLNVALNKYQQLNYQFNSSAIKLLVEILPDIEYSSRIEMVEAFK